MAGYKVAGKVFFVTGGAEGIGRAICEGVLERQGKVFFIDVQEEKGKATHAELATTFGADNVQFAVGDVTDRLAFEETFQQAVKAFGYVDVMLNNAGVLGESRPKTVVTVNILGTIYGTEIASAHMRKDLGGKGGRIVNVSSLFGFLEIPNTPIYGASKQAIRSYTHALALSPTLEETGLEYATIHPDGVSTALHLDLKPGDILFLEEMTKQSIERGLVPMPRVVEAFFSLVSLDKMNGAALLVTSEKSTFMKLSAQEIGNTYPPQTRAKL